jgi:hypothetical protein
MKTGLDALGIVENMIGSEKHEKGRNALGTTENESGGAKYEKGTWYPRYRRKRVLERKTLKRDPIPTVPPKMSPGEQNMKKDPYALGTTEN